MNNPHRPGADLLTDRPTFHDHRALALELVAVFGLAGRLALDRLRPSLQDVELAVDAILAPLDVHRAAIVLLDDQRLRRQGFHIAVTERIAVAHFGGHIDRFDQFAALGLLGWRGKLHLNQFGAQAAADQRPLAGPQHGLVHIELVRIDGALHHRFTQSVAGGDEDHLRKTGLRVDGEHDPGRAQVGAHHALDTRTQGHMLVRKALVHPVADGPVVVERGKHLADFVQDVVDPGHVQKRFLLAGK